MSSELIAGGKKEFFLKIILFLLILIWNLAIFTRFFYESYPNISIMEPALKKVFGTVCHSDPGKVLSCNGNSTFACARCTGIYNGSLLLSFVFIFTHPYKKKNKKIPWLFLPMLADVILNFAGLDIYYHYRAYITGFLSGSAGIFYFYSGLFSNLSDR